MCAGSEASSDVIWINEPGDKYNIFFQCIIY